MKKEYLEIMVDLETMSTTPNASIVSIGAVSMDFETGIISHNFYRTVDLKSSVDGGGHIDPETVMWWISQKPEAKKALAVEPISLKDALIDLAKFMRCLNNGRDVRVWGNGATFDNVILRSAFERCGLIAPWKFWDDMCYRTMKNLHKEIQLERGGTHHNALDDATFQACHLIKIMKEKK